MSTVAIVCGNGSSASGSETTEIRQRACITIYRINDHVGGRTTALRSFRVSQSRHFRSYRWQHQCRASGESVHCENVDQVLPIKQLSEEGR